MAPQSSGASERLERPGSCSTEQLRHGALGSNMFKQFFLFIRCFFSIIKNDFSMVFFGVLNGFLVFLGVFHVFLC